MGKPVISVNFGFSKIYQNFSYISTREQNKFRCFFLKCFANIIFSLNIFHTFDNALS